MEGLNHQSYTQELNILLFLQLSLCRAEKLQIYEENVPNVNRETECVYDEDCQLLYQPNIRLLLTII